MSENAEKKPSYPKKNRKPRVSCVKNAAFAKDVRINLRKAKFRTKRVTNPEDAEPEKWLPPPQPKLSLPSSDEEVEDEEEKEEFLHYVKLTASEDRNYDVKDEKDCSLGCCKSCGLLSHDLTHISKGVKANTHNEHKHDKEHHTESELINILNSIERNKNNDKNAPGRSNILETLKYKKTTDNDGKLVRNLKKDDIEKSDTEIETLEDDLDFLLTLKEPVVSKTTTFSHMSSSKIKEPTSKSASVPTKSVELENWLDSVLDI